MVESKNTNGLDGGAQNAHSAEKTKGQRVMAVRPIEGGCQEADITAATI